MQSDEVKKLAHLSRLALSDGDIASYTKDFESILGYVQDLQHISGGKSDGRRSAAGYGLRHDANIDSPDRAAIVALFPEQAEGQVKVPKVLSYED